MKKLLVTGATGFLGSRVIERFADAPALQIIATGRQMKPHNTVKADNVRYVLGDLTDLKFVEGLMHGVDIVVHAAALSAQMGKSERFRRANVEVTRNMVEVARAHGVEKFVFISSPSIYFKMRHQHGLREEADLPRPVNVYAQTKREAELLVQASGIPFIIFRPRALIGRGDTVIMPRLLRAHREGRLRRMGDELNRVDMTPVSNVVDAIALSLEAQGEAVNQTYNISNGKPELLWPLLDGLLSQLELPPLTKRVPLAVALVVAFFLEWHAKWLNGHKEPALTIYGVGTLTMSFSMEINKAQNLLGYQPQQSTEEALFEFVEWHKSFQS